MYYQYMLFDLFFFDFVFVADLNKINPSSGKTLLAETMLFGAIFAINFLVYPDSVVTFYCLCYCVG